MNGNIKDSEMNEPLLSIVIANYNYGRFLEEAIKSIDGQCDDGKIELIICDAASSDNSVDIIKKFANGLPANTSYFDWKKTGLTTHNAQLITWWCSEKDKGQSDAFNKGFSYAKGRFLTWLNADDFFAPNALNTVLRYIEKFPECEWFAGGECRISANRQIMRFDRTRKFQRIRADVGDLQPNGPSSFFSRSLYERAGGYVDESFHYAMDIELWERFYAVAHAQYKQIPGYLWMFRVHEDSKTASEEAGVSMSHDKSNMAWYRRIQECQIVKRRYAKYPLTWWRRMISLSLLENMMSRIDTLRYRHKDWNSFFPDKNANLGVF